MITRISTPAPGQEEQILESYEESNGREGLTRSNPGDGAARDSQGTWWKERRRGRLTARMSPGSGWCGQSGGAPNH